VNHPTDMSERGLETLMVESLTGRRRGAAGNVARDVSLQREAGYLGKQFYIVGAVTEGSQQLREFIQAGKKIVITTVQKFPFIIDHFHDEVLVKKKIGGRARAMVVTSGIERAMQYKAAFDAYLAERKSPCKAIVAFSGEHEFRGANHDEANQNAQEHSDKNAARIEHDGR
jgi:hypothetical protein